MSKPRSNEVATTAERIDVLIQPLPHNEEGGGGTPLVSADQTLGSETIDVGAVDPRQFSTTPGYGYPYHPVNTAMQVPRSPSVGGSAAEDGGAYISDMTQQVCMPPETGPFEHVPVARPPPQVMTALGSMPLPPENCKRIPEKFVAKPIIEEREIYVAKKEVQERVIEIPHVHYQHKFAEVGNKFRIRKLVPTIREVIKEVPREIYKPVVEEKVIEVPQGVKYVEVPVEVPCLYPPKIVPKPKAQIVERVVETVKPVVKERVIEVPQTVVKQIPKIKTVEVPYFIPRYVEKIIEVPYQPPHAGHLPPALTKDMPSFVTCNIPGPPVVESEQFSPTFAGAPAPFTLGPMEMSGLQEINLPYEAKIEVTVSQNPIPGAHTSPRSPSETVTKTITTNAHQQHATAASGQFPKSTQLVPGGIDFSHGFQWGAPPNARLSRGQFPPGGQFHPGMAAPPPGRFGMRPMMVTCPPEVGNVRFSGVLSEPDILTRAGVMSYSGFRSDGNAQMLFPPLPFESGVPMDVHTRAPDIRAIQQAHGQLQQNEHHPLISRITQNMRQEYDQTQIDGVSCVPFSTVCPKQ